jgi:NAD(P)-dependent dehydrogenase (short-subunit alcohol dehydrogenase family)
MGQLDGRVAIITGAGQGIGRGIARRFAREGASVLVAEIKASSGEETAAELRAAGAKARFVPTDVGDKAQVHLMVDAALDAFGRIDVLVNNAWGGGSFCRLEHKTDEQMEHGMRIGFTSAFWSMQAVFPHMRRNGFGRIVNLCSLNGVNAHMYTAEYNTAKEALRTLSRTAAREWARHGITVNVICPAAVSAAYEAFRAASPENAELMLKQNPMGRMGDPEEDIAPVAVFLASAGSRYLTGNTLFVDGGSHVNGVAWAPELPD